jgi:hypothetical protein
MASFREEVPIARRLALRSQVKSSFQDPPRMLRRTGGWSSPGVDDG